MRITIHKRIQTLVLPTLPLGIGYGLGTWGLRGLSAPGANQKAVAVWECQKIQGPSAGSGFRASSPVRELQYFF